MASVTVTLNIAATPPVSLSPKALEIDCSGETIHWKPATGSTFAFVALVFSDQNPFYGVVVGDSEITARDSNQAKKEYNYRVLVQYSGKFYSSDGGVMTGGPTIRNN